MAGFGFEKNISGLSGGNENGVGVKRFDVNCISFHHFEGVVCNAEEELVVQCCVDYAQHVCLSSLNLQLESVCIIQIDNIINMCDEGSNYIC